MSPGPESQAEADRRLIRRLRELIEALDSRVPHLEREGEIGIAGDASALRARALDRIARLEHEQAKKSPA